MSSETEQLFADFDRHFSRAVEIAKQLSSSDIRNRKLFEKRQATLRRLKVSVKLFKKREEERRKQSLELNNLMDAKLNEIRAEFPGVVDHLM
jgi:phage-related protein